MFGDVLIVDDERDIRELVAAFLEEHGFAPRVAPNSDLALREIALRRPSLVLLDVYLKGGSLDGHEVLQLLLERDPDLPVIMMSGRGGVDMAVRAIRAGAHDYIEKPIDLKRLLTTLEMAAEKLELRNEVAELRRKALVDFELIGESAAMMRLNRRVKKIAPTNSRVFISGPIGSGKHHVARLIHAESQRARGPFLTLNMHQTDPDTIRTTLFGREIDGHVEAGILERAHMGTLYLDEVSGLSEAVQEELLRVLTDQRFRRVDGKQSINVDVRIISSSVLSGDALLKDKLIREDLYYRLNVVPVAVPSLAERREDIPELVSYFISELAPELNVRPRKFAPDAMAILQAHDWPGNARQLRNVVEMVLITASQSEDDMLSIEALPSELLSDTRLDSVADAGTRIISLPLRDAREIFEREYLTAQIARFSGNISRTAEFIGMERSALHRKLKTLGISSGARLGSVG